MDAGGRLDILMRHFLLLILLMLGNSGLPRTVFGQSFEIDILFSNRYRPHVEVIKALEQTVRANDIRLFPGQENGDLSEEKAQLLIIQRRKPDLIIVFGEDALQAVLSSRTHMPVLSVMSMTLNSDMQQLLDISGIDLRPSPMQIANKLALLLPQHAKILSFYNPDYSAAYIDEASDAFRKHQLELIAKPWPQRDIQLTLNNNMKTADAYWMQLEYQSVEPDTLRLLFGLAKHGKQLIGLSEKYVRAGALIAWSPQFQAMGRQAANLANRILTGEHASSIAVQHPEKMKLSIRSNHTAEERR